MVSPIAYRSLLCLPLDLLIFRTLLVPVLGLIEPAGSCCVRWQPVGRHESHDMELQNPIYLFSFYVKDIHYQEKVYARQVAVSDPLLRRGFIMGPF